MAWDATRRASLGMATCRLAHDTYIFMPCSGATGMTLGCVTPLSLGFTGVKVNCCKRHSGAHARGRQAEKATQQAKPRRVERHKIGTKYRLHA